jgi:hypothetical protein
MIPGQLFFHYETMLYSHAAAFVFPVFGEGLKKSLTEPWTNPTSMPELK